MTTLPASPPISYEQTALWPVPYVADSRAKTLAWPATFGAWGGVSREASGAAYGRNSSVSFATYDPKSHSWKTYQLCLDVALPASSLIWPRSGMMRSGTAYLQDTLARPTSETVSGLLPTPAARDFRDLNRVRANSSQLARKSPSLATRLLAFGMPWQAISPAYAVAMGFPSNWLVPLSACAATPLSL